MKCSYSLKTSTYVPFDYTAANLATIVDYCIVYTGNSCMPGGYYDQLYHILTACTEQCPNSKDMDIAAITDSVVEYISVTTGYHSREFMNSWHSA